MRPTPVSIILTRHAPANDVGVSRYLHIRAKTDCRSSPDKYAVARTPVVQKRSIRSIAVGRRLSSDRKELHG